jgi:flagellin
MGNLSVQRNIGATKFKMGNSLSKLASGKRITKAMDDAAGLAIAEKMGAQIKSLEQATKNVSQASAMMRTAEGGMSQISDMLIRGKELAMQASNGTLSDSQRTTLNNEFSQIMSEIDRQTGTTEFNGKKLLSGDFDPNASEQVEVQAGPNATSADRISLNEIAATDTASLGLTGASIDTAANAGASLNAIDSAITSVNQSRGNIGAIEGRLQSAANSIAVGKENLQAAQSQIQDLDYAKEITNFTQRQVQLSAGISALTQGLKARESMVGGLMNTIG